MELEAFHHLQYDRSGMGSNGKIKHILSAEAQQMRQWSHETIRKKDPPL